MVLQRGSRTTVWGRSSKIGDFVRVLLNDSVVAHGYVDNNNIWQMSFTPPNNEGPYDITAFSSLGYVTIKDVWFGDVWVCSGQSNMEFMVRGLINATEEYKDTVNYPNVRLFKVANVVSGTPLEDFTQVSQVWDKPSEATIKYFSAVCWLYGKYLSQHLNRPIGLVETNWGGTPIESWSSSDALQKCSNVSTQGQRADVNPFTHSALFNSMVYPLLRNTIYGVIWYQGEANAGKPAQYACQFPAMINDWRMKFHQLSSNTTYANFPFGFVQLAPWLQDPNNRLFADLRWSQTAQIGFVPNYKMKNTFMAVAMDLPDFTSPAGSIHPRYKHDIARRLMLSSMAVAYHQTGFDYQRPFPTSYKLDQTHSHIVIEFDHGSTPIEVRVTAGFEICCTTGRHICKEIDSGWKNATMTSHSTTSVTLDAHNCTIGGVRYAWRESPCALRKCAVYSRDSNLPAPPFKREAFL
ncbi:hypothetical protein FSP39_011831 [Pinctada imbricata]|uniref:Sialate O-acetylesterase domain-containing protein n=1 Tax=Pinctada imbricata TaxID=66713 RepID=A0AA88YAG5_PINIB|nr:hypothetical protein FSP39_011831 [Pinctada imbricata]